MIQVLEVAGSPVNTVVVPTNPGLRAVEFTIEDAVAIVTSIFTGQTQAQQWPGADQWSGTMTLPPLTQSQADVWLSFLMECRGMANPFLLGDPLKRIPSGAVHGAPLVDGAHIAGTTLLSTRGWDASKFRLLLTGDYLQLGYRLHRVLGTVNSDANGRAQIAIWPSLREVPPDGQSVVLKNTVGLFRLATNKRAWSSDYTRLTRMSFQVMEYR